MVTYSSAPSTSSGGFETHSKSDQFCLVSASTLIVGISPGDVMVPSPLFPRSCRWLGVRPSARPETALTILRIEGRQERRKLIAFEPLLLRRSKPRGAPKPHSLQADTLTLSALGCSGEAPARAVVATVRPRVNAPYNNGKADNFPASRRSGPSRKPYSALRGLCPIRTPVHVGECPAERGSPGEPRRGVSP
jgi:hypothetical protein